MGGYNFLYIANVTSLSNVAITGCYGGGRYGMIINKSGVMTPISIPSNATVNVDLTDIIILAVSANSSATGYPMVFLYS